MASMQPVPPGSPWRDGRRWAQTAPHRRRPRLACGTIRRACVPPRKPPSFCSDVCWIPGFIAHWQSVYGVVSDDCVGRAQWNAAPPSPAPEAQPVLRATWRPGMSSLQVPGLLTGSFWPPCPLPSPPLPPLAYSFSESPRLPSPPGWSQLVRLRCQAMNQPIG